MALSQLPWDIILIILDNLQVIEMVPLLKTCRTFRRLMEPIVYRHIDEYHHRFLRSKGQIFNTLMERRDLLPHIFSYYGTLEPYIAGSNLIEGAGSGSPDESAPTLTARIMATIFTQAINIRDLQFTDMTDWHEGPCDTWREIATAVSRMCLNRFSVERYFFEGDVLPILRRQTELTELELSYYTPGLEESDLEGTDFPKLKELTATLVQAAKIVPGRPVESLEIHVWGCSYNGAGPLFDRLRLASRPIISLGIPLFFSGHNQDKGSHQSVNESNHSGDETDDNDKDESFLATIRMVFNYLPQIEALTITVDGDVSQEVELGYREVPDEVIGWM
ncbi:hypothetical protein FRC04_002828 [Tulasnella sp. 424]|nr:hypothetical protein FRC04_002828 [Tulasnella sp. 424]